MSLSVGFRTQTEWAPSNPTRAFVGILESKMDGDDYLNLEMIRDARAQYERSNEPQEYKEAVRSFCNWCEGLWKTLGEQPESYLAVVFA